MERAAIAARKRSANTRRAYEADWSDFGRWCARAGRASLPASADTVSLYLVDLARRGLLLSTIQRRVTSIQARHLAAGLASPAPAGGEVREVLAGLRRRLGTEPPNRKAALSVVELRRMLDAEPGDAIGARNRALLLVGFASGLRRSELAGLDLGDVEQRPEGLVLHVGRSKTDQEGAGRLVGVHRGRRRVTCPVRALRAWLDVRGSSAGPLFVRCVRRRRDRGVEVTGDRLQGAAVAVVVKAAARRAGLDAARVSGHSLRAGCATASAANHAPELAIMARTGHRSLAMLGRYVRHGSVFAVDPLAGAL